MIRRASVTLGSAITSKPLNQVDPLTVLPAEKKLVSFGTGFGDGCCQTDHPLAAPATTESGLTSQRVARTTVRAASAAKDGVTGQTPLAPGVDDVVLDVNEVVGEEETGAAMTAPPRRASSPSKSALTPIPR